MTNQHAPFVRPVVEQKKESVNLPEMLNKAFGKETAARLLPPQPATKTFKPLKPDFSNPDSEDKKELANGMAYFVWLTKAVIESIGSLWSRIQYSSERFVHRGISLDFGGKDFPEPAKGSAEQKYAISAGRVKDAIDGVVRELMQNFVEVLGKYKAAKESLNDIYEKAYVVLEKISQTVGFGLLDKDSIFKKFDKLVHKYGESLAQTAQVPSAPTLAKIFADVTPWFTGAGAVDSKRITDGIISSSDMSFFDLLRQGYEQQTIMRNCEKRVDETLGELQRFQQSSAALRQNPYLAQFVTVVQQVQADIRRDKDLSVPSAPHLPVASGSR